MSTNHVKLTFSFISIELLVLLVFFLLQIVFEVNVLLSRKKPLPVLRNFCLNLVSTRDNGQNMHIKHAKVTSVNRTEKPQFPFTDLSMFSGLEYS